MLVLGLNLLRISRLCRQQDQKGIPYTEQERAILKVIMDLCHEVIAAQQEGRTGFEIGWLSCQAFALTQAYLADHPEL